MVSIEHLAAAAGLELPVENIFRFEEWPEDRGGTLVHFHLFYKGKLPAASSGKAGTRNPEKHEIRLALHKQMKILWREHPSLREWMIPREDDPKGLNRPTAEIRGDRFERCGNFFVPLIESKYGLACALDILFLRRDEPGGFIVSGGDLDNRLKVLLDAMRVPRTCDEIPDRWIPSADEKPLYCVMEDDVLVKEIKITTDRLIAPLEEDERRNDVVLVIKVKTLITNHQNSYIEMWN